MARVHDQIVDVLMHLDTFINSKDRMSMANLKVVYERGHRPAIRLLNEKRQVQEEIPIDTWDSDTIIEFVNERIIN
ncbi:15 kDa seleno protein [Schistosoma japonicum]|nr:15 kDa seleno protein [Schistosoma japonicum]